MQDKENSALFKIPIDLLKVTDGLNSTYYAHFMIKLSV